MNEPGDLTVSTGAKLFAAVCEHDPSRPVIKGSFCVDDPDSGDSHNYTGSLDGGHYSDIYETTEKMNTEFGFDAPPCIDDLKRCRRYTAVCNRFWIIWIQLGSISIIC